jgi:hypothetical protein
LSRRLNRWRSTFPAAAHSFAAPSPIRLGAIRSVTPVPNCQAIVRKCQAWWRGAT